MRIQSTGPAPSTPAFRRDRDLRIDLFRGISLLVIYVDHVTSYSRGFGALPRGLAHVWTLRDVSWTSAAEFFVFLSGYAAGLVYRPLLDERGLLFGQLRATRRTLQLYVANFILLGAMLAILGSFGGVSRRFLDKLELTFVAEEPLQALWAFATLRYAPHDLGILYLYLVLLPFVPATIWALRKSPVPVLAASAALYLAVQLEPSVRVGDMVDPRGVTFNPFAWQLLFVAGAALGSARMLREVTRSGWRLAAALGLLIGLVAMHRYADRLLPPDAASWLPELPRYDAPARSQRNLGPLRIAGFVLWLGLLLLLVPRSETLARLCWLQAVIACGQYSLAIFCLGQLLSLAASLALARLGGGLAAYLLFCAAGTIVTLAAAVALRRITVMAVRGSTRAA